MKKLLVLALILLAAPAFGEIKNCTNALFNANVCRVVDTNDVFMFDIPDNKMDKLIKKAARMAGYSANVPCTAALVLDGICTQEQLDTAQSVPHACSSELVAKKLCPANKLGQPRSRKEMAFAQVRLMIMNDWIRGEEAQDLREAGDATTQQQINAIADPDISW